MEQQQSSFKEKERIELREPRRFKVTIYNDPLGYADLILNGDPEEYLKNMTGSHGLEI